jgi:hypothetical protein
LVIVFSRCSFRLAARKSSTIEAALPALDLFVSNANEKSDDAVHFNRTFSPTDAGASLKPPSL